MAEIINFRQARKAVKRKQHEATAAANRARFGQTKAQRTKQSIEAARAERQIDGAKLDSDTAPDD